ncbi:MAG: xylulokinase [Firmicutes bacterium]|nr:xylulokinase [Bacillota bacterium]
MKLSTVLGIDIGTSGTKVVVMSGQGSVLASYTASYPMDVPKPGYAEQHPQDWWQATVEAVRAVIGQVLAQGVDMEVAGISFSGQMHGLVPLDAQGQVIRPSIIWCDLRSVKEAAYLEREIGRAQIITWTQNPPLPNFTLTKLLWMREHEPELFHRIATVLLPKDYVRLQMTGELAMDMSDASGTLLLDVANRKWSREMCDAAGIPFAWLPRLVEANEVAGKLTAEAAQAMGLVAGIPVVAGAADQAAGAVGLGIAEPGVVAAVFGTSGVVLAATAQPQRDPAGRLHTFCHAAPDRWYVMGVTQAAGGSLQWYRRRFAQAAEQAAQSAGKDVYDLLMEQAQSVSPGADGVMFLPYLLGERTPHLDPQATGAWIGLRFHHEAAHLVRAILEGVSYSLKDCYSAMRELGIDATAWRAAGGGANGRVWMDIFASVVGNDVKVLQGAHGPAYGAAILAAQGVQLLSVEESRRLTEGGETVHPRGEWIDRYQKLYPLYGRAYREMKSVMHELVEICE